MPCVVRRTRPRAHMTLIIWRQASWDQSFSQTDAARSTTHGERDASEPGFGRGGERDTLRGRMRCALIGVTGQLGHDLARTFDLPGELVRLPHAALDLTEPGAIARVLRDVRPTHVVNCAAYNLVDRAEDERARAFALNAEAVGTLAETCEALGATLVHFSTDYVFDGAKRTPYTEDDAPAPLSVYAASKLAGERLARERCRRAFVIRV